jgi:hypothetical protein
MIAVSALALNHLPQLLSRIQNYFDCGMTRLEVPLTLYVFVCYSFQGLLRRKLLFLLVKLTLLED